MYQKYLIRPTQNALDLSVPSLHMPIGFADWPSKNFRIDQHSAKKRQGYAEDRDLGTGVDVQSIIYFKTSAGSTYTVYLTDTNACLRSSANTWSYITDQYTTGTVSSISTDTVTGSSSGWATGTGNPALNDYFIMDDDLSSTSEPDGDWAKIESVTNDTTLVLDGSYLGATSSGDYTIRKSYTVPDNERWSWAILKDKLCFTNGDTNAQYFDGSTCSALNTTKATRARYCIAYADRLVLADYYSSGTRNQIAVMWSKNGDPTDYSDSTYGEADMSDSEHPITGLGKAGPNLIIYKSDSLVFGNKTGTPTAPIAFSREKPGTGTISPSGIVHANGTNYFVGRNDFYKIDSDYALPIGEKVRYKFFDLVDPTELKKVFGYANTLQDEVRWLCTDVNNQRRCFVYNYKTDEWYHYVYNDDMSCGGRGEI